MVIDLHALSALADFAHHAARLMPQHHRQVRRRSAPFNLIKLGMTHAAGRNPDQDFVLMGNWIRQFSQLQRLRVIRQIDDLREEQCFHVRMLSGADHP